MMAHDLASELPDRAVVAAQIERARSAGTRSGRRIIEVLEEIAGLPPEQLVAVLGQAFHYPVLDMGTLSRLRPAFETIPFAEACRKNCLACRDEGGALHLVFSDPFDETLPAWLEEAVQERSELHLAYHADLLAYLNRYEENMRAMDGVLENSSENTAEAAAVENISLRQISEDASPVVKLVHSTLYDAMKSGASDIHLESDVGGMVIKYRIDGVLNSVGNIPGPEFGEQVISRIKVMSELDIAERRIPQDGRFKVAVQGREVDFRVSIMPSVHGEDAVLRILDRRTGDEMKGLRLDDLGFDPVTMARLRKLSNEPYGMVLVTGPTGSGKTTTLYAAISEINRGQDKIITIEDPVEYRLPGVLQIPVNEKKGLSFARGLRSILRHDPDKIMVGEIRDPETAQIAVQSALTGHLVFTTVHANNVFDVIGRFMHMGVDPYSFVAALNGILAQRLVRLVCTHCAEEYRPDESLLLESGIDPAHAADFRFMRGTGCRHCRGTGYKGRVAIAEMLNLNDEIRELILAREPIRRVKEAARRNGTRYLRESAVELVKDGRASLEDINRVTFVD